jgi:DNA-binding MarR family transcriptional regulator
VSDRTIEDEDYRRLLAFRDGVRRFLHWSEDQARAVGLTAAQHQLMLAIRGHVDEDRSGGPVAPTIGDVAGHLLVRHHSAVELIGRAEAAGLVARHEDPNDLRVVRLSLTDDGERRLQQLSALHLEELRRLQPVLSPMWAGLP